MLDFIKGSGTQEYQQLLSLKPEYNEAIFLDTDANRLYYAGKVLDVRVEVEIVLDEHSMCHQKYHFTNPDGETVTIDDALIPKLDGYSVNFHDVSSGEVFDFHDGLLCARDKFLIEAMAKLLGITVTYTHWATVHHYSDLLNGIYDKFTEVEVYQNGDGDWQYDYGEFKWNWRDAASGQILYTYTVPEGHILLQNDGTYITPKYVYVGEPPTRIELPQEEYTIPGEPFDEIATIRVKSLTMNRQSKDFNFYDGGGRPENQAMLNDLGGLKTGTTVGELEHETVSEVISRMLFEDASLVRTQDTSAYVKFHEDYIETNGLDDGQKCYIEVGAPYPLARDFDTVFLPETWQLQVDGRPQGEPQVLQQWLDTSYYLSDSQHVWKNYEHEDDDSPESWNTYLVTNDEDRGNIEHYVNCHVVAGDKSLYYGIVHYEGIANAKDQYGNETYVDGEGVEHYYAEGTSGEVQSSNYLGFTGEEHTDNKWHKDQEGLSLKFSLYAAWRIFSNASETSKETIWKKRNDEPDAAYLGNDAKEESCGLAIPNQCIYFKWPSATRPEDGFYIYLPVGCDIAEIGAAHDGACDEWSAKCTAELVKNPSTGEPVRVPIENRFGYTSDYLKYSILKSAVITNVRVKFNVLDPNA